MRASGVALATLVTLTSAALVYHRANTAVEMQRVSYKSGADTVQAMLTLPEGQGPFPAVIVIHEWWGLNSWVEANARKLAQQGYLTLAIDLYRGAVAESPEMAHELSRGLPEDRALRDLQAAFNYLSTRPDVERTRIATLGWCMGGSYSLQAAARIPDLAACVVFYGRLITDEELIAQINAPVLGIFGGQDKGIPVKTVRVFEKECNRLGKQVSIHVYPRAGHAFMNENNKDNYSEKDAADAWEKTIAFLADYLKK